MRGECPVGEKYGRFTVVAKDNSASGKTKWICKCDCGVVKSVISSNLRRGVTKSCGCLQRELQSTRQTIDRTGQVFGRLKVIGKDGFKGGQVAWLCQCQCGNTVTVPSYYLGSGTTQSCGCLQRERASEFSRTHGMSNSREYRIWSAMKTRCSNENRDNYKYYGGRGISVCSRWINSFENFIADMGPCPSDKHSIERKDVNGNYEPGNCYWATQSEQLRNTSRSVRVTWDGRSVTLKELAEITGVDYDLIQQRLKGGWDVVKAVTQPKRQRRTCPE